MNAMEAITKTMERYYEITGLHSYFVQDEGDIISASAKEKNFFCKCLKTSSNALKHCDECTVENYTEALRSKKTMTYSCHAGLVKWSVPVEYDDMTGVIISEGVISAQQAKDSAQWIDYLAEHYNVSKSILLSNYHEVKIMSEQQVEEAIGLLEKLIAYHGTLID